MKKIPVKHFSLSKTKGAQHFPVLDGRLAEKLQQLLANKYAPLAPDDPIRLDIERHIALLQTQKDATDEE